MASLFSLEGKVAVVTGASSGIGRGIAKGFARAGASVIVVARRPAALEATVSAIQGAGGKAAAVVCDLLRAYRATAEAEGNCATERDAKRARVDDGGDGNGVGAGGAAADAGAMDLAGLVAACSAPFGPVDILVNNAGVNLRQPYADVTPSSWATTIDLNLTVPFFLARAFVDSTMKARGGGKVVNIASLQSARAFRDSAPYGASKGGLAQLTRAMAQAWSGPGRNVTCNAVAPGFFRTELTAPVFADAPRAQALAAKTCVGRNGEVEDLVGVCVFLASKASDYVTGQVIFCDGGFTAK